MIEALRGRKRTHRCGDLRPEHAGMRARLAGWAHRVRDHGGVIFLDLRDRFGITQVVFRPEHLGEEVMQRARSIGSEYVVMVEGKVLIPSSPRTVAGRPVVVSMMVTTAPSTAAPVRLSKTRPKGSMRAASKLASLPSNASE